mgnify:CR=1 FL=1
MATDALDGMKWLGWVIIGFAVVTVYLLIELIVKRFKNK